MGRLFGTDGVRGLANGDLTPELALSVAVAAARVLVESDGSHQPLAIVGRDPRASGEMLEAAVVAGLTSAGANVVRVGVLPTPAVAYLVGADQRRPRGDALAPRTTRCRTTASSSSRPAARSCRTSSRSASSRRSQDGHGLVGRPTGAGIGRVHDLLDGAEHYIKHLVASVPHRLNGIKVVVDCANGAASEVGPTAYEEAGAEVIAIHAEPDGLNINDDCGSTHLDEGAARPCWPRAPTWASRTTATPTAAWPSPRRVTVVDGDEIMAILALAMRDAGTLTEDTLVATVMSNLGLRIAMKQSGIRLIETKVGDRYVLEELQRGRPGPRRRAERAHRHAGVRDDRRRRADRPAPDGAAGVQRQVAGRPGRGACTSCRRC